MSTHTVKKYALKTVTVILWIIGSVLALVAIVLISLQIPKVQDFATRQAESYLQKKLGTEIRIGKFRSDFRKDILLEGVYLEDQKGDTLWYSEHLAADFDFLGLLKSKVGLKTLELRNATAHISRTLPDSTANYDFILDAFTSPTPTTPVDTTSAGFTYDIGTLDFQNIYLTYVDEVNGQNVKTRLGGLTVKMDELDLTKEIYRIDDITLHDSYVDMVQTKVPPEGEQEPMTMQFGLSTVNVDRLHVKYRNGVAKQYIDSNIGHASMKADNIDLQKSRIDLASFSLQNSTLAYAQNADMPAEYKVVNPEEALEAVEEAVSKTTGQPVNWVFTLADLNVSEVDLGFDNYDEPRLAKGLDYNHIQAKNLNVQLSDLFYSTNRTTAQLENLSMKEKSGFEVRQFTAGILFDSVQTELSDLVLETGNSRIARRIKVGYPSLETAADDLSKLTLSADLENTYIGFRDIALLQPAMTSQPPLAGNLNQTVYLSGQVNGRMDNLLLNNVRVRGWRNTELAASGRIKGLPNVENLFANVQLSRFHTTAADIKSLMPAGTLPANITIPPVIDVEGTFNGSMTAFDVDATVRTSFGNAIAKIDMTPGRGPGQERFKGNVRLMHFNLGKMMQMPELGTATMTANVNGTGMTPETMVATVDGRVQRLEYGGYAYHDIDLDVKANRNLYDFKASSTKDQNLAFNIDGVANLRSAQPSFAFNSNIEGIDLQALKLYPEDLRIRGQIQGNLRGADLNSMNGTIIARKTAITTNNTPLNLDTLNLELTQQPGRTQVVLASDVLSANLDGNIALGDLGPELMNHISRYYDLGNGPYKASTKTKQFTFSMALHKPRVITAFVPGLRRLRVDTVQGSYNNQTANLEFKAVVPRFRYTGVRVDSVTLNIHSDPTKLSYAITADQIRQDTSMRISNLRLGGDVQDNVVGARMAIQNEAGQDQTALGVQVSQLRNAFQVKFMPELLINTDAWEVAPDNYVRYYTTSGAVVANGLRLSNGPQSIGLQSKNPNNQNSPLDVNISNLDLGYLARAFTQQDSLLAGQLNGKATVNDIATNLSFTANMALTGLAYQNSPVGDLSFKAANTSPNRYDVDARLTGNGNNVTLAGYYMATPESPLHFDVKLDQLNLASMEAFTAGMLKDMGGGLGGTVAIRGTAADPDIVGDLLFNNASFNVAMLNSTYRIADEHLIVNNQGIQFNDFELLDSLNNKAVVNGGILTTNFIDYAFDLRATTDNFLVMNSTAADNELYYGTVYVDSDTRITGDLNLPVINTQVKVASSKLTYVMPDEPVTVEREGIVVFVDMDHVNNRFMSRKKVIDTTEAVMQGIELTMNLEVTDESEVTVLVDPESGDNLVIRGNANLNVGYDATEEITLTGRYDVTSGRYEMSLYGLIRRSFDIAKGSNMVWSGDLMEPQTDLTAIYKIQASSAELVSDQLAGADATQLNQYKQKLPYEVHLGMEGELMKPTLNFSIDLEENAKAQADDVILAKLDQLAQPTQESERIKQVFSLLALNRFMAQDPLTSSAGGGVNSALRGSASKVLSQQLGSLTDKYLGGLGLDVGLNSYDDYSTGEGESRTDLNIAMQRQLLNNRLTVRYGTDINLEGSDQGASGNSSGFGGDVSVEYSILADGRLRLRAFRENSYEGFLDGQLTRTGISLIFVRDYDNLAELFKNVGKAK